ncbi:hypothetical protein PIB30_057106 [Stylosanthes scabra]|uniref:Uncharacterized protein n=1 Tax=Stylosanthes scabra TaxID=79078 RepID=A0ABU6XKB0_9FABA|nr:hypothetical protein [Stylosanthes scabra]
MTFELQWKSQRPSSDLNSHVRAELVICEASWGFLRESNEARETTSFRYSSKQNELAWTPSRALGLFLATSSFPVAILKPHPTASHFSGGEGHVIYSSYSVKNSNSFFMASTAEPSPYSTSRRRDESEFNLREWGMKGRISRENTTSRRYSG